MRTEPPLLSARLSRSEIRNLKKSVRRQSCVVAAEQLLVDSIQKGHCKLALHRYFMLYRINAWRCVPYEAYCQSLADGINQDELMKIIARVDSKHSQASN